MAEIVYLLSNPRMSGLVKIGKTTKSLSERMKELHSTGVPEPFVVECAFEVDDCTTREKAAHQALAKYRLERREFFEISVADALRKILPLLGDYSVHQAKDSYDIPGLVEKLKQKESARRLKADQQREERQRIAFEKQHQQRIRSEIEHQLLVEEAEIHAWYRQEFATHFPERNVLFFSIPLAFSVCVFLPELMPKLTDAGVLIVALLFGWSGGNLLKNWWVGQRLNSRECLALKEELANKLRAVREIVRRCPGCGQQLRFERAKVIENNARFDWTCPNCKSEVMLNNLFEHG